MAKEKPKNRARKDRSGRARFKKASDALKQLKEIEAAKRRILTGKATGIIESTHKSRQRLQNELNKLRTLTDAIDAFEND